VWGPKPIALGYIGAPLATAISFNLISISSIVYGIFFVPNTAWHPISRRSFTNLGVLVRLGMAGIGLSNRSVISPLLITYVHVQGKLRLSGGVGNSWAVSDFLSRAGMASLMR
jgi:Na+-driven multidrug efflux pump